MGTDQRVRREERPLTVYHVLRVRAIALKSGKPGSEWMSNARCLAGDFGRISFVERWWMDQSIARDNPHLRWILASIRAYRAGQIDLGGLSANISAEASALEGDVGEPVRQAMERLALDLDVAYEHATFLGKFDTAELERVLGRAEAIITGQNPISRSPGTV